MDGSLEQYQSEIVTALNSIDLNAVEFAMDTLLAARRQRRTVFVVGNGGSASTAGHIATDFMLGSSLSNPPLRVVTLTDNVTTITETGNDLEFMVIFSRQLANLAQSEDLVSMVSASGNSSNSLDAVSTARDLGMTTIGLTGFGGGKPAKQVVGWVHVPTRSGAYGVVQDAHLAINHMITEQLQRKVEEEASS